MRSIDPEQPPLIETMEEIMDSRLSPAKMLSQIIGAVTLFALALAALGIFSVISYAVSERTHEIGIRLAFGAQKAEIFLVILRRGMVLLGIGLGLGVAGALVLMKLLRMLWFGVTPYDLISYAAAGIVLISAGMLAMMAPLDARRPSIR
jgi:ABC-type antimicrobial peptide transport system permease subunit